MSSNPPPLIINQNQRNRRKWLQSLIYPSRVDPWRLKVAWESLATNYRKASYMMESLWSLSITGWFISCSRRLQLWFRGNGESTTECDHSSKCQRGHFKRRERSRLKILTYRAWTALLKHVNTITHAIEEQWRHLSRTISTITAV